jgi:hypothetical protein
VGGEPGSVRSHGSQSHQPRLESRRRIQRNGRRQTGHGADDESEFGRLAGASVRTFPRALAAFREMVNARGSELRQLTKVPLEHVIVQGRRATIGIIVLPVS